MKSLSRSANCYLIQFDRLELDQPQPPAVLYTLEELSSSFENCGQKCANLFKSRADMEQWIAWLNKPEKPAGQPAKVVPSEEATLEEQYCRLIVCGPIAENASWIESRR